MGVSWDRENSTEVPVVDSRLWHGVFWALVFEAVAAGLIGIILFGFLGYLAFWR